MNNFKLNAAVKKYSEDFKSDPEQTKELIKVDLDEADAETVITALEKKPEEKKETTSNYKWYDEFDARIQKKEVRNPYTQQNNSVITGWELQKKKHHKFVEPHVAVQLNSFADGYDLSGLGNLLIPKDTMKTGDVITYETWAKEQGRDTSKDLNVLLLKN